MSNVLLRQICILDGIQTGPFGSQLHADDYTEIGVAVVMPQDLGENVIRHDKIAHISEQLANTLARHKLESGDIVFSRRGDVTRRSLVKPDDLPMICGTGCLRLRPDSGSSESRV